MIRFGLVGLIVVGTLLVVSGAARSEDAASFDEGMARVQSMWFEMENEAGLSALRDLVEAHGDQPYVRERREKIIQMAANLAFMASQPAPDPKTLVSGKLHAYDPRSGKIKIEYTPETSGDLMRREAGLGLPVEFTGPFTIEVEGSAFPRGDAPAIQFGFQKNNDDEHEYWAVSYGAPEFSKGGQNTRLEAAAFHYLEGMEIQRVSGRKRSPAKNGEPYKAVFSVTKRGFKATLCGKQVVKLKKRAGLFGSTWVEFAKWDKITYKGPVHRYWMWGLARKSVADKIPEFEKTFDPREHLPGWLFTAK